MANVIAVENSTASKIGLVSATYVSQASCPTSCPLMGAGCYAERGKVGIHTSRLNKGGEDDPTALALEEAEAIAGLTGYRPLRVHVVGDCSTNEAAEIVGEAMRVHTARHGQPAWTYTHAWREVRRESWGDVAVLASCESKADVADASARSHATAIIVSRHETAKRHHANTSLLDTVGVDTIPCPNQTRGRTCEQCKLCLYPRSPDDPSISFAAHGATRIVKRMLARVS